MYKCVKIILPSLILRIHFLITRSNLNYGRKPNSEIEEIRKGDAENRGALQGKGSVAKRLVQPKKETEKDKPSRTTCNTEEQMKMITRKKRTCWCQILNSRDRSENKNYSKAEME